MDVSFSGVILNHNESERMYHLLKAYTFLIATLEDDYFGINTEICF